MDVMYYDLFDNLKNVHVIINTCSSFIYALALSGEKLSMLSRPLNWPW